MTAYPPGPFVLEYPLVVQNLAHAITINCDIIGAHVTGTDPSLIAMRAKGGVPVDLDIAANALWDVIRTFYNTEALCSTFNLWSVTADNADRLFVSGGTLTAPNGAAAAATHLAWSSIYTFRSGNGNTLKFTFLETTAVGNDRIPLASDVVNGVPAFRAYVMSDDNIAMARDRSFPVAPMNSSYSQNEKTANRRFRS